MSPPWVDTLTRGNTSGHFEFPQLIPVPDGVISTVNQIYWDHHSTKYHGVENYVEEQTNKPDTRKHDLRCWLDKDCWYSGQHKTENAVLIIRFRVRKLRKHILTIRWLYPVSGFLHCPGEKASDQLFLPQLIFVKTLMSKTLCEDKLAGLGPYRYIHMRCPPEEPHLAWGGVSFFGDFRHLSWAYFLCKWAKILICWCQSFGHL